MESKLGGIGEGAERSLGTRWDGRAHQRFGYAILSHVLHIHCIAHTHTLRVLRIRIDTADAPVLHIQKYCTYSQKSSIAPVSMDTCASMPRPESGDAGPRADLE